MGPQRWLPCVALLALAPREAHAQSTRSVADAIELGEHACLDHATVASRATTWLGRDQIDRRVQVRVTESAAHAVDIVILRQGETAGERHLKPRNIPCADLQAAVGLAIALAIDATFLQELTGEPALPVAVETQRQRSRPIESWLPVAPAPSPADHPPVSKAHWDVGAHALLHGLAGVLPSYAVAGSFGLELSHTFLAVRASGWAALSHPAELGGGEVTVSMIAGQGSLCARKEAGSWIGLGCGGVMAGRWVAHGKDFGEDYAPALPWAAATASLGMRWKLTSWVALAAELQAMFPFVRPRLEVLDPGGRVAASLEAPAAGFGVGVGPVLTFF
jgi:hypothetical protein